MEKKEFLAGIIVFLSIFLLSDHLASAGENSKLSKGQTLYIPAYSHIYSGNREIPFMLTITLSIRNIDPEHSINIVTADYYETQGRLLKRYIKTPVIVKPLESLRYVISEKDETGGSGANFLLEWKADKLVNPPIVESIMIGAKSQQGVSFTSRGRVIFPSE